MRIKMFINIGVIYSLFITFIVIEIPLIIVTISVDEILVTSFSVFFTLAWIVISYMFRKILFRKVTISNAGVTTSYFDIIFADFPWADINSIAKSNDNRIQSLRIVYQSDKILLININRRKIRKIVELCPIEQLRDQMIKLNFVF